MRIRRVTIQRFRGIEHLQFQPGGRTVILGPNNAGKSAVVEALDLLLHPGLGRPRPAPEEADYFRRDPSAGFEIEAVLGDLPTDLPRTEAVRALRATADVLRTGPGDLDSVLDRYSAAVLTAAYVAPRMDQGLFVMTAHQANGKELDVVVLADAMDRFWRDNDEARLLLYVVVTRASSSWEVVAPDEGASPLLVHLTG